MARERHAANLGKYSYKRAEGPSVCPLQPPVCNDRPVILSGNSAWVPGKNATMRPGLKNDNHAYTRGHWKKLTECAVCGVTGILVTRTVVVTNTEPRLDARENLQLRSALQSTRAGALREISPPSGLRGSHVKKSTGPASVSVLWRQ